MTTAVRGPRVRRLHLQRRRAWLIGGFLAALALLVPPLALAQGSVGAPDADEGREVGVRQRPLAGLPLNGLDDDPPVPPDPDPVPAPPPPRRVSVAVTGDILVHLPVTAQAAADAGGGAAYDFAPMLEGLRPLLQTADLALCHLEVPLAGAHVPPSGYPRFNAPDELARGLADVGYDGCSTASNHAVDQGFDGLVATRDALEQAGLAVTGTARSAAESVTVTMHDAEGVRVAHLSATYGTNGLPVPAEAPWSVQLLDVERVLAQAAAARAQGAEVVLASLHWGVEYDHDVTADQRAVAEEVAASGLVDVIVGHHAHVVQPVERIGGTLVLYGLGNLLSNQSAACCHPATQDGLLALLEIVERPRADGGGFDVAVAAVPTFVSRPGHRVVAVPDRLRDGTADSLLEASLARTSAVLDPATAPISWPDDPLRVRLADPGAPVSPL